MITFYKFFNFDPPENESLPQKLIKITHFPLLEASSSTLPSFRFLLIIACDLQQC